MWKLQRMDCAGQQQKEGNHLVQTCIQGTPPSSVSYSAVANLGISVPYPPQDQRCAQAPQGEQPLAQPRGVDNGKAQDGTAHSANDTGCVRRKHAHSGPSPDAIPEPSSPSALQCIATVATATSGCSASAKSTGATTACFSAATSSSAAAPSSTSAPSSAAAAAGTADTAAVAPTAASDNTTPPTIAAAATAAATATTHATAAPATLTPSSPRPPPRP